VLHRQVLTLNKDVSEPEPKDRRGQKGEGEGVGEEGTTEGSSDVGSGAQAGESTLEGVWLTGKQRQGAHPGVERDGRFKAGVGLA
jgi:hypothetical protein